MNDGKVVEADILIDQRSDDGVGRVGGEKLLIRQGGVDVFDDITSDLMDERIDLGGRELGRRWTEERGGLLYGHDGVKSTTRLGCSWVGKVDGIGACRR